MKTYTDDEIVRALECCSQSDSACENCPANGICDDDSYCFTGAILDLIKRQQAEIKELQEILGGTAKVQSQTCAVERVKAVREFAERLTKHLSYSHSEGEQLQNLIIRNAIDALLKKMTEGES